MEAKLKDIAQICSGVFLKDAPQPDTIYLQVSDFDSSGKFRNSTVPLLKGYDVKAKYFLMDNDLLFAAKGTCIFCAIYHSEEIGRAVASTSFLIIRILRPEIVLPDYLFWFLDREDTKRKLLVEATAGPIISVSKAQLEEIEVPVPSISAQEKIVMIDTLQRQSDRLRSEIADKRRLITATLLTKSISNK